VKRPEKPEFIAGGSNRITSDKGGLKEALNSSPSVLSDFIRLDQYIIRVLVLTLSTP
jgi:hypothetical protein